LQSRDQTLLVQPPAALKQQLLALPGKNTSEDKGKSCQSGKVADKATEKTATAPLTWASLHNALPLVASILLALVVSFYFRPQDKATTAPSENPALSQTHLGEEILRHIHTELDMLEADRQISMEQ